MSGYSATSRAAFERVDVTAGQARVLAAFKPGARLTRQELVTLTGMPINGITGRVFELLAAGRLESLPAVNGRHPLRLKEYTQGATRSYESINGTASLAAASSLPTFNAAARPETSRERSEPNRAEVSRAAAPDTTSEAYRHECEIRFVANLPNDAARNKYLTGVHGKRGEAAWKRLRTDVWRAMRVAA